MCRKKSPWHTLSSQMGRVLSVRKVWRVAKRFVPLTWLTVNRVAITRSEMPPRVSISLSFKLSCRTILTTLVMWHVLTLSIISTRLIQIWSLRIMCTPLSSSNYSETQGQLKSLSLRSRETFVKKREFLRSPLQNRQAVARY